MNTGKANPHNLFSILLSTKYAFTGLIFFLLYIPDFAQTQYNVASGDTATLRTYLQTKSNCTIVLQGSYPMAFPLLVKKKSNVTIEGSGAIWNTTGAFAFIADSSQRIRIRNLRISNRSQVSTEVFTFKYCDYCGLEKIKFTDIDTVKRFALFHLASTNGYVKNCDIDMVRSGIQLGTDLVSEPEDQATRDCLVEGNLITNFTSQAIWTRQRQQIVTGLASRIGHIIRGNTVKKQYIGNSSCGANHGCFIGIEVWGNEVIVESNVIEGEPSGKTNTGISFAHAYKSICRNNTLLGPFNYQGIELQMVNNSIISGNIIEKVSSSTEINCAGIGVSSNDGVAYPPSEQNLISMNQILSSQKGILLGKSQSNLISENLIRDSDTAIYSLGSSYDLTNNTFVNNFLCIFQLGGNTNDKPLSISGNTFDSTGRSVFYSADSSGTGRPIHFVGNRIFIWGENVEYPAAIVLKCGPSKIANNVFIENPISRNFSAVAIAKDVGYTLGSNFMHMVTGNYSHNALLSPQSIVSGSQVAPLNYSTGGTNPWYNSPDYMNANFP